jgi:hypothetical protein
VQTIRKPGFEGRKMNSNTTRRELFQAGTQSVLTASIFAGLVGGHRDNSRFNSKMSIEDLWLGFPRQDQKLVAEMVGFSHFNEERVKELVKSYPELANACWDWGFGDWETALGAASHTGQRGIAEFLLAHGGRIDIFAAAMLGFTNVVRSFVEAQPGIQRTLGPHGIPLLSHAKAGGQAAVDTVAYLESLGDAGMGLKVAPLLEENKPRFLGKYSSTEHDLSVVCRLNNSGLLVIDVHAGESQSNNRMIQHVGDQEFFPSGVPSVQIHFALDREKATSLTIRGSVPEVTLVRTSD